MAYAEVAQTQPVSSLLDDSGRLIDRLGEIYGRVVKIGDSLHGSRPRDVPPPNGAPNKIEPSATVRRNLDKMQNWICDIEGELGRIETQL